MPPLLRNLAAATLLIAASFASKTTDVELDTYGILTGPLTTTFTPAATCLSKPTTRQYRPGAYPDLEVGCQGPGGNECCPDKWARYRYFSPGVCPSGYQACALPSTRQRQETTMMCCPDNFDCPSNVLYGMCRSSLNTIRTATYTDTAGQTSTATWYAVTATAIQIRFQASDSDVVPIPTDSFRLPPPPTEEELERERKKAKGGLSTPEKAGIAVAVVVAVLSFVLGVFWGRKVQKKQKMKRAPTIEPVPATSPAPGPGQEPAGAASDEPAAPPPYTK